MREARTRMILVEFIRGYDEREVTYKIEIKHKTKQNNEDTREEKIRVA